MKTSFLHLFLSAAAACAALLPASHAAPYAFTTGLPDGRMATTSRPAGPGVLGTESADDFLLSSATTLTSGSFTGLITNSGLIGSVGVEIYRVFPQDSGVASGNVPTRANSPSDVAFAARDTAGAMLSFSTSTLSSSFVAANSVLNGINKMPAQTTGGEGAVSGAEVRFDFSFVSALTLPAGHYFFVPQVQVTGGEFMWLSAPRPLFLGDLQEWIRNDNLDPDWLRVGTDIVGGAPAPTFNAAFSLNGTTVAAPDGGSTLWLLGLGLSALGVLRRKLGAR